MTTHHPYPPHQPAPAPAYPTAPPWAAAPPAAVPQQPVPGAVTPYGAPYGQHGGLLVPYPEEMADAARPRPPSWWPVVGWTLLLGVLGAVAASRRAARARRGRNSPAPYWVAWGVTMAAGVALAGAVAAVGVPAYLEYREAAVTKVVQEKIRADARAGTAVTSVTCEPLGPRDAAGDRPYDCLLTLEDGRSGAVTVTADSDGDWTAVRRK